MNSIIIDKENHCIEEIKRFCDVSTTINIIETFTSPKAALEFLIKNNVELIFLDIELGPINGLDLLKCLENPPYIIIISNSEKYAYNCYNYWSVIDYVKKPISNPRLLKSISKALRFNSMKFTDANDFFTRKTKKLKANIDGIANEFSPEEIFFVKSIGNYTQLNLANKSYMIKKSLKDVYAELKFNQFIQIHRSFIVNTKKITLYDGSKIEINKKSIPIGNTFKRNVSEKLQDLSLKVSINHKKNHPQNQSTL